VSPPTVVTSVTIEPTTTTLVETKAAVPDPVPTAAVTNLLAQTNSD